MFDVFLHGHRDVPKVALTFDDGPNPPRTEEILDILAAEGVRASFFLIGRFAERWPRTVERIMAAGHVIGNHSHTHTRWVSDYDRAEVVLGHLTGRSSRYGRAHLFDYASYGLWGAVRSGDVLTIDSDANPADWSRATPEEVVRATLEHPSLANGSIIDLHDSSEFEDDPARLSRPVPTVRALRTIIRGLRDRGLEPVGLDELELAEPKSWDPGKEGAATTWPD
jgi:peptidoglycan/xylan/chitin deacetylase (PgdA/CDA1 family)